MQQEKPEHQTSVHETGSLTNKSYRVSIIIPAYNEERRIKETLDHMTRYLAKQSFTAEIIVVNDGSSDKTTQIVHENFPHVHIIAYSPNRGKGYAVKTGMNHAKGDYRFFYDADGSTPIEEMDNTWPLFETGADIIIGSRSLPKSNVQVRQNPLRESMGRTFNLFVKMLLGESFIDTQCGFKGFTSLCATDIFCRQRLDRFAFDAELLYIARKRGYTILELPVIWRNSRDSRVNIIADSLRMIRDLFRIRFNDIRGAYK